MEAAGRRGEPVDWFWNSCCSMGLIEVAVTLAMVEVTSGKRSQLSLILKSALAPLGSPGP